MKKNNRISLILLLILLLLTFIYMFIDIVQNDDEVYTYEISVITSTRNNESLSILKEGAEQAAVDLNVNIRFIFLSNDYDIEEQRDLLIRESKNNMDAIIIDPIEDKAIAETIEEVNNKVPVIIIQSSLDTKSNINKILCDEYDLGKELVTVALSYKRSGEFLLISGGVNDMEVKSMKQGIVDTLNGIDRSYSIYEILPENKETYGEISEIISNYNIDGIICLDIKAMEYIAEYREMLINAKEKDNEFKLYGVGNTSKIISFLEQGIINGTAIKNEFSIGYLAVENAIKLKNNKKVSNKLLKSNVVTSENMYSKENERILFQFIR